MRNSYLAQDFYETQVISHVETIFKITDELRSLNNIYRTIEHVPKYHRKLINKNKNWVHGKQNGKVYYWTDNDKKWFEEIVNFNKLNFGIGNKRFKQFEEYFGTERKCLNCGEKYRIRDSLGLWNCYREFVSGPFRKKIYSMHTDGKETTHGILKIPLFAFIILNVNVPRLNAIKLVVIEPIDKNNKRNICLLKSKIFVYISQE